MRKYDETTLKVAERVLKRSEEIVRQRQIKATKIRRISYAVTGLCAAAILCFGIFKLIKYTLGRNSNPHGNYQPTTSDTSEDVCNEKCKDLVEYHEREECYKDCFFGH